MFFFDRNITLIKMSFFSYSISLFVAKAYVLNHQSQHPVVATEISPSLNYFICCIFHIVYLRYAFLFCKFYRNLYLVIDSWRLNKQSLPGNKQCPFLRNRLRGYLLTPFAWKQDNQCHYQLNTNKGNGIRQGCYNYTPHMAIRATLVLYDLHSI